LACALAQEYITYKPGRLPLIVSAPHGGSLRPASIPDRENGCWVQSTNSCDFNHTCSPKDANQCGVSTAQDINTLELTNEISDALFSLTGNQPHVIINNLHRIKLDANRDKPEGAQGILEANTAWDQFQSYIDQSAAAVTSTCARGVYLDVHGQAHSEQWIEWGYLLTGNQLNSNDSVLNTLAGQSSYRNLARVSQNTFAQLIRGATTSFGGLLSSDIYGGYKSVPSPAYPGPNGGNYFSGGYNTQRHGSLNGGTIDGVQMECNSNLRTNATARVAYANELAKVFIKWFQDQYQLNLTNDPCIKYSQRK